MRLFWGILNDLNAVQGTLFHLKSDVLSYIKYFENRASEGKGNLKALDTSGHLKHLSNIYL